MPLLSISGGTLTADGKIIPNAPIWVPPVIKQ